MEVQLFKHNFDKKCLTNLKFYLKARTELSTLIIFKNTIGTPGEKILLSISINLEFLHKKNHGKVGFDKFCVKTVNVLIKLEEHIRFLIPSS